MKRLFLLTAMLCCIVFTCGFSQVKIGDNATTPDGSALLEVEATNRGFLPPRMTESERDLIANPATGLVIYCTNCCAAGGELQVYDGTKWTNAIMETACFPAHITKKNTANWFFGSFAGLDFNSGSPVPLIGGQHIALEGGSTISDDNGNLLFYTDGSTVWNKNHGIMETGLLGSSKNTSTQDGLIVKNPGSTTHYYIFTLDHFDVGVLNNGLRYSEVDMSLNGGLGGVVPATKNTQCTYLLAKI